MSKRQSVAELVKAVHHAKKARALILVEEGPGAMYDAANVVCNTLVRLLRVIQS